MRVPRRWGLDAAHPVAIFRAGPLKAAQSRGVTNVPCSERRREIKRRRHRRKKLGQLGKRLQKATVSEKASISEKIRLLTPGGDVIVENWGLKTR
jgi:hypothetical protein